MIWQNRMVEFRVLKSDFLGLKLSSALYSLCKLP